MGLDCVIVRDLQSSKYQRLVVTFIKNCKNKSAAFESYLFTAVTLLSTMKPHNLLLTFRYGI